MRVGRQREAVVRARRAVRIEAEILGATHGSLRHVADRLAGIDRFDERDLVGARLDGIRDLVQELAARVAGCLRPAGTERLGRSLGGLVDLGRAAARDLRDHRIVDWRKGLEGLAAAAVRLAIDQVRDRSLAETLQEAFGASD
jgi:hypothetical protein